MKLLETARTGFEARSLRERGIIAATVATLILFGFGQGLWYGQIESALGANEEVRRIEGALPAKEVALAELERREAQDPNDALREKLESLEKSLVLQEKAYFEQLDSLVSPSEMVSVLYDVLGNAKGVELISLKNLPATPLQVVDGEGPVAGSIYRHGVRVEFEASYFDTVAYLRSLEEVGDRLIFRSMHYEVVTHPRARVVVVVETMGMDMEWIGV